MSEQRHIFYNLVKDENSLTELLRNFLDYTLFKQLFFRELIKVETGLLPEGNEIFTQRRLADKGQPDMYVCSDVMDILIEVKITDTSLTSSQPDKYLQYLQDSKKKYKKLIFLLPDSYTHHSNLLARATAFCDSNNMDFDQTVGIRYWPQVIQLINEYELHKVSVLFDHFRSLLKSWFEPAFVNLTLKQINFMFNKDIPTVLLKLYETIDALFSEFSSRGYQINKAKNGNEYGLYLKDSQGVPLVYIGVWYLVWQKTGSPICLAVSVNEHGSEIKSKFDQFIQTQNRSVTREGAWECTGIEKDSLYADSNLLEVAKKELELVLNYLQ